MSSDFLGFDLFPSFSDRDVYMYIVLREVGKVGIFSRRSLSPRRSRKQRNAKLGTRHECRRGTRTVVFSRGPYVVRARYISRPRSPGGSGTAVAELALRPGRSSARRVASSRKPRVAGTRGTRERASEHSWRG